MSRSLAMFAVLIHMNMYTQEGYTSETITINGKNIYFEKIGTGEPLLLLHGYGQSSKAWKSYITSFKNDFTVYLIDLPGHGKSDSFTSTLSIKSVAADVNSLLDYLGLTRIKAIGFSFGAEVLFQLALLHPELVTSMISIGSTGSWDVDNFRQTKRSFTFEHRENFPWLIEAQTSEQQIKILFEEFRNYSIQLSDAELEAITTRILLVSGDEDTGVNLNEIMRVKRHLPNCAIWILPNVKHSAHTGVNKEIFIERAKAFLANDN